MGYNDFIISPLLYRDILGENYDKQVLEKIIQNPVAWVNSLPIHEYAHVMLRVAAQNFGGDPRQYVEVLWNKMLIPVMTRYYMNLEKYRFYKAVKERDYVNHRYMLPLCGVCTTKGEITICTAVVKQLIRDLCGLWKWLHNRPYDDPVILSIEEFCTKLMTGAEFEDLQGHIDHIKEDLPDEPEEPEQEDQEEPTEE